MSSEHAFEDKGKVKPKPSQEAAGPQHDAGSLSAADMDGKLDASTLTQMQQTVGNAAVQRFLAQRQGAEPTEVRDETAESINAKRGSGSALDSHIAKKAESAMGQDFSGVNVHTDSQADDLSRDLGAKAFTTGNDIFFQSGAYDPGSSEGQHLIAHELTHVAQQGGGAPAGQNKMTVNDPNDQYEEEAESVADQIMNQPDPAVQRQAEPEEEEEEAVQTKLDASLQRQEEEEVLAKPDLSLQPIEEEEEMLQPKLDPSLQRQEEEEEMMQPKLDPALQRQEEEEVMPKLDPSLQRQEEEEEMMQPKLDPSLQRQEEEEVAMPMADPSLQRQEEEEMMQPKLDPALQRQEEEEGEEMVMTKSDPSIMRHDELPE